MQSNGSWAAGYRSGSGGYPHGAGSDDALGSLGSHEAAIHRRCSFKASGLVSLENPAGQVRGLPW